MSDLAEKILKTVDHLDRLAEAAIQDGYSLSVVGERGESYFSTCVPEDTRRRCAADREIVDWFHSLVAEYKHLKSLHYLLDGQAQELRVLEARIADFAAVILPALARGYGIQP